MKPLVFAALAGLCWGVGEVCTRSVLHSRQVGAMGVLLVRAAVALPPAMLAYFLLAPLLRTEPAPLMRADASTFAKLVLGSGLLAGFGGVFFFYLALGQPGGEISRVKPIAFTLAPAVAVLLGWTVLGESVTWQRAAGVAVILAGVAILTSVR